MASVTLAEAKANLDELIERAARGEPVEITREGEPVARLTAARKRIDVEALERLAASLPYQEEDSGTFVRRMRDEDRY